MQKDIPPTSSLKSSELYQGIPDSGGDYRILTAAAEKRWRLRTWMEKKQLDGVIISRRDNFSWLTCGGDNHVLTNSDIGVGHLLITPEHQYLVAHSMDGQRLLEEQVRNQGYELIELRWFESDPRVMALALAGKNVVADTIFPGVIEANYEIGTLHFPLDEIEIARMRWLGQRTAEILEDTARFIRPGMSEVQAARHMKTAFGQDGIDLDVLIAGSDERIFQYRHPLPTQKKIDRYLLLHPAARRWGLHANVSRCVYFGSVPEEVRRPYHAAAMIEGRILSMLRPGLRFADILEYQKTWYDEFGFPDEWELHFQGGPTAYQVADPLRSQTSTGVETNQAFDWFITVTGAKVEELSILTDSGVELASLGKNWPVIEVISNWGRFAVPDLLEING